MVLTKSLNLPTEEELTVPEVNVSSSVLRAASFHLGKYCETVNNEYMLCHSEYPHDPRKCLNEGKAVTNCTLEFFRKLKENCRAEFDVHSNCIDKSSYQYEFTPCRKTQGLYDKCMLEKLDLERPHYGYFCEIKVHDSKRPRPELPALPEITNPTPKLPDDYPRFKAKYEQRHSFD